MNLTFLIQHINLTIKISINSINISPGNMHENSMFIIDVVNDNINQLIHCSAQSENIMYCKTKKYYKLFI